MLQYAAVFFVVALIAAVFGFTGIAVGAAEIAKICSSSSSRCSSFRCSSACSDAPRSNPRANALVER